MRYIAIILALSAPLSFAATTVTREAGPDGPRSFTVEGRCADVKGVVLPTPLVEIVRAPDGKKLKAGFRPPVATDVDRRDKKVCSYECKAGASPIVLNAGDQPMLVCVDLQ